MNRYKARAITTEFWHPGENYLEKIVKCVKGKIAQGDIIVISEKAISTAINNIIDEKTVKPELSAKVISKFWMRIVWGYILGRISHFPENMLKRLRKYPLEMGSHHKQIALQYAGPLQALMFGSEGGIDGSNLAYSYVSLPLKKPAEIAKIIQQQIWLSLRKKVCLIIVDTDKTYSFRNFHFTPRPKSIRGIYSFGGVLSYIVGRMFKLRRRATPLAVVGSKLYTEEILKITQFAERKRGYGSGKTVWDMAENFGVGLTSVTWKMLETVKHKPIVVVRRNREKGK